MSEQKHPVAPYSVSIQIDAEDWAYIQRVARTIADYIEEHTIENCSFVCGGGGGSHSVYASHREITVERYHAELEEWQKLIMERQREERAGRGSHDLEMP